MEVSIALLLLLFRCGKALEVFWVFGEFLDKVGLTGLPNRSDQFLLPTCSRVVCVSAACVLWLLVGSCS
jgi:hypothetical protein